MYPTGIPRKGTQVKLDTVGAALGVGSVAKGATAKVASTAVATTVGRCRLTLSNPR